MRRISEIITTFDMKTIRMMSVIRNLFRGKHGGSRPEKHPPEFIIAPDKFKGTLTAAEVAGEISCALSRAFPDAVMHICPMADGGDGSAAALAGFLALEPQQIRLHNALMEECDITFYASGTVCAVDSASIVGLAMLGARKLSPWLTTTAGIGEFILAMLSRGMEKIYLGIGGTATVDAGIGMLGVLGARFYDVNGEEITERPLRARHLGLIFSADFSLIDRRLLKSVLFALADVDLPLIADCFNSPLPSSLTFAAQKGITLEDIPFLFNSLHNFQTAVDSALLPPAAEPPFQGAGGGLGYAIHRILHCPCTSGAAHMAEIYQIAGLTSKATCLITGEGCYDIQSLQGKVVGTLTALASSSDCPVIIIAGRSTITNQSPASPPPIITTSPFMAAGSPLTHATALEAMKKSMPLLIRSLQTTIKPGQSPD